MRVSDELPGTGPLQRIATLEAELHDLRRHLSLQRRRRSMLPKWLAALACACAVAMTSLAYSDTSFDCRNGAMPRGLNCFQPNSPAVASAINGNTKAIADSLSSLESRMAAIEPRVTSLETRAGAVESREVTVSGIATFVHNTCGNGPTTPCVVSLSGFASAPNCVVTMESVDTTGYREQMVILGTTARSLSVWRGLYQGGGRRWSSATSALATDATSSGTNYFTQIAPMYVVRSAPGLTLPHW